MVGVMDRVEIWDAARWDAYEASSADAFNELEDLLTGESTHANGRDSSDAGGPA